MSDIAPVDEDDGKEVDIEASIETELAGMNKKGKDMPPRLFQPIKLSVQCVLFFKVDEKINPVEFVEKICEAAAQGTVKSRFLNRLTPMTCMERANERGLEDVCKTVLAKSFTLRKEGESDNEQPGGPTVNLCSLYAQAMPADYSSMLFDRLSATTALLQEIMLLRRLLLLSQTITKSI